MSTTTTDPVAAGQPAATAEVDQSASWGAGVLSGLLTAAVVVAFGLALALAIVPRSMGGSALTVLTGSMTPTYQPGDMVVVKPVDAAEVQVGDVVTFQPVSGDPTLVTHRVITKQLGGSTEGTLFVTQGDANGAPDDPIVPSQIMGKVVYDVPLVGHAALLAGEHREVLVTGVAVVLLAYGGVMLIRPTRTRTVPAGPGKEHQS